jgi:effector-binding domain-containing protein
MVQGCRVVQNEGFVAQNVQVVIVPECYTAVVACTTTWQEFPALWKRLLDQVWAFLAGSDLRTDGHNVMLYRESGPDLHVEVGVQVVRAFESSGAVVSSTLPPGRAVMARHRGPYEGLAQAHRAVLDYCASQGLELTGTRWEVYGDWHTDPSHLETDVYWQLA